MLSVVVPCYNEEEVLPETIRRVTRACDDWGGRFEAIFVDDGSADRTWALIEDAADADPRVRGLKLSRNFGHQAALTAGLEAAMGERILMMDADLQDPPELIADMAVLIDRGYEVVYGVRRTRMSETAFKRATAAAFYRLLNMLSNTEIPPDTGDFRMVSRRVLNEFLAMPEQDRFVRGMFAWIGHRQIGLEYDRDPRAAGETKYSLMKMLKFSVSAVTGFSTKPLRAASVFALISLGIAAAMTIYVFWSLLFYDTVQGWASILLAVSFFSSAQLLTLGIMGSYIGRIYEEVKGRPLYVEETRTGTENDNAG